MRKNKNDQNPSTRSRVHSEHTKTHKHIQRILLNSIDFKWKSRDNGSVNLLKFKDFRSFYSDSELSGQSHLLQKSAPDINNKNMNAVPDWTWRQFLRANLGLDVEKKIRHFKWGNLISKFAWLMISFKKNY